MPRMPLDTRPLSRYPSATWSCDSLPDVHACGHHAEAGKHQVIEDLLTALGAEFHRLWLENESLKKQHGYRTDASSVHMSSRGKGDAHGHEINPDPGGDVLESSPGAELHIRNISSTGTEEKYEQLYDLTRTFKSLCGRNRSSISVREIMQMHANQQGLNPLDDSIAALAPRFETTINTLNACLDHVTASQHLDPPAKEVHLETFAAIMNPQEVAARVSRAVLDDAAEIKGVFVREEAVRKVAQATQIVAGELYQTKSKETSNVQRAMLYLDSSIGVVILLNAIVISLSTDIQPGAAMWLWIEGVFTIIFVTEILLKVGVRGPANFFFGVDARWNIFDSVIVTSALLDLSFQLAGGRFPIGNLSTARLLRFLRLTKLVRVLKLKMFAELSVMISGFFAGVRTLLWSMVALTFLLFVLGVFLTQVVGHRELPWDELCLGTEGVAAKECLRGAEHLSMFSQELFGNILRSMFTIFRCFTDGCSSIDGTPLTPHILNTYGPGAAICYMFVVLFVTFGLFNLIMSTFVETTIANASQGESFLYSEHLQVARKLQQLIVLFCTGAEDALPTSPPTRPVYGSILKVVTKLRKAFRGASALEELPDFEDKNVANLSLEVTHEEFMRLLERPEVEDLLDDLDISVASRQALFDTLDANNNGTLEVNEMVQGLLSLRSSADKGNIVASLLAIRSMQKTLKVVEGLSLHQHKAVKDILATLHSEGKPLKATSKDVHSAPHGSSWKSSLARGQVMAIH